VATELIARFDALFPEFHTLYVEEWCPHCINIILAAWQLAEECPAIGFRATGSLDAGYHLLPGMIGMKKGKPKYLIEKND